MPFTLTDLANLDAAIKTGAMVVHYADRRVEYRSAKDMLIERTLILSQLSPPGTIPAINRTVRMRGDKGL
jgi:hypothetical protein